MISNKKSLTYIYLVCIVISFLGATHCSYAQNANPDCKKFKFGDFVSGDPHDSIYVFRGFANWYEMHTSKGFRNIFYIKWKDDCTFWLIFHSSSAKDETLKKFQENDTLTYEAISGSDSSITFKVTEKTNVYNQTLSRENNLDTWQYMYTRDAELNSDTLNDFLSDSVKKNFSTFNLAETEQVENVLSLLKQANITSIDTILSDEFKSVSPNLVDYDKYLKNTYGKLISYSAYSIPVDLGKSNFLGSPVSTYSIYVLDADFEKVKGTVKITIALKKNDLKILKLNVQADENATVPFIENLTKDFWLNIKTKEYKKIYSNSSQMIRDKATFKELRKILSLVANSGMASDHKLIAQNYALNEGVSYVIVIYILEKEKTKSYLQLNYISENGNYSLGGLNYKQQ